MRSRDKIGLLLGLVSIIAIVYLIKGLPISSQTAASSQPQGISSHTIVSKDTDIINDAVKAVEVIETTRQQLRQVSPMENSVPRSEVSLDLVRGAKHKPTRQPSSASPKDQRYTVQSGDSLGLIAEKVYGKDDIQMKIEHLYKANSDVLASPDMVKEGQKLKIPPISSVASNDEKQGILSRLFAGNRNTNTEVATLSSSNVSYHKYEVRKGDTLWGIASKTLGSGSRCDEIKKLNKSLIKNENSLSEGMILRIPVK